MKFAWMIISLLVALDPSYALAQQSIAIARAVERQLANLSGAYEELQDNIDSNPNSNIGLAAIQSACVSVIYDEWEKSYLGILRGVPLNLNKIPGLEDYGLFLVERTRDESALNVYRSGMVDAIKVELENRRNSGRGPRRSEEFKFSITNSHIDDFFQAARYCFTGDMVKILDRTLPRPHRLNLKDAPEEIYKAVWSQSSQGGIQVQLMQDDSNPNDLMGAQ